MVPVFSGLTTLVRIGVFAVILLVGMVPALVFALAGVSWQWVLVPIAIAAVAGAYLVSKIR